MMVLSSKIITHPMRYCPTRMRYLIKGTNILTTMKIVELLPYFISVFIFLFLIIIDINTEDFKSFIINTI